MKKAIIGIVVAVALVCGIIAVVKVSGNKSNTQNGVKIQTAQEMKQTIENINKKLENQLPSLETREVDIADEVTLKSITGLSSNNNIEAVVVSEPFMSSQAYSAVMVKVSDDANIENIKKEMFDNIDMRKWICVSAEKLWVTNYGNIIFLVMSSEEWGKPVYNEFKQVVGGTVGKELEKTEEI